MSVERICEGIIDVASRHDLLAAAFALFLVSTIVLGLMHQGEIAGELMIIIVKMFKRQARALRRIFRRLKVEITTIRGH